MALRATKGDEKPAKAKIWRRTGEHKAGFSTEFNMALAGHKQGMKMGLAGGRSRA
jgi:hypothetical protein